MTYLRLSPIYHESHESLHLELVLSKVLAQKCVSFQHQDTVTSAECVYMRHTFTRAMYDFVITLL